MILKSIIFFIILFVIWTGIANRSSFSISQHQWQENVIRAEKIIFDDAPANIIVGSSLSKELSADTLKNFYNLSLGGLSVLDGLSVLKTKSQLPKNIFIEINVLTRPENKTFKSLVTSPVLNLAKQNISSFRSDKQPLPIVGKLVISPLLKTVLRIWSKVNSKFRLSESKEVRENGIFFQKLLDLQKLSYSQCDKSELTKHVELLNSYISELESRGSKVYFFEMPVNPELVNLKRAVYIRTIIAERFPNHGILRVPDNIKDYKTTDGLHLSKMEAANFSSFFKKEIESLL